MGALFIIPGSLLYQNYRKNGLASLRICDVMPDGQKRQVIIIE